MSTPRTSNLTTCLLRPLLLMIFVRQGKVLFGVPFHIDQIAVSSEKRLNPPPTPCGFCAVREEPTFLGIDFLCSPLLVLESQDLGQAENRIAETTHTHSQQQISIEYTVYEYMGAVRNCMSKTCYDQRQLVEPRDWENSSRERPTIGPRKGNKIIVNLDTAWCLDCAADAHLAHFDCTASRKSSSWKASCMLISPAQAQAVLSKSAYWQRLEAANQSFAAEFRVGRRLDGDWTNVTSKALPIRAMSLPSSFQVWMEEGQRLR